MTTTANPHETAEDPDGVGLRRTVNRETGEVKTTKLVELGETVHIDSVLYLRREERAKRIDEMCCERRPS